LPFTKAELILALFESAANLTGLFATLGAIQGASLCSSQTKLDFHFSPLVITFQNMRTGSFLRAAPLRKKTEMTHGSLPASPCSDREVSADYTMEVVPSPA